MMLENEGIEELAIWNFIDKFIHHLYKNKPAFWHIVVNFSDLYYKIFPYDSSIHTSRIEKVNSEDLKTFGIEQEIIEIKTVNDFTIIPIAINKRIAFYLFIKNENLTFDFFILKNILECLLEKEAENLQLYPSFLPFFLSLNDPEIDKINIQIQQKKYFYFLNGLSGTGKNTFIKNHLMYCYGVNPKSLCLSKNSEVGKIQKFLVNNKVIIFIDELAYCTEEDQKKIQLEIIEKKQDTILFICSAYDPAILSSRAVITHELAALCLNERIIFPSLQKRIKFLSSVLSQYLYFKGINLPSFFTENWLNKQSFSRGFTEIFAFFQEYSAPQESVIELLNNGKSIREVVKEIEISAIDFSIKIVGKSQNKIAKYLGVSRGSLQHKLKKYGYSNKDWEE